MSYPKNFPSGAQIQVCVVAGGDITDPATDHSCNQRLFSPLEHKDGEVDIKHLSFSPMIHSATQHSQQSFHGAMDPGSLVYVLKTTGQNGGVILGQANDVVNPDNRAAGNEDLLSGQTWQELFNRTIKINIPPDIQETTEKGAKVKKIKEKGKEHSHSLLKGLPSHGALHSMSGFRIPQLNNVPTAIQQFAGLQTNDMLSNMPGDLMSLGGMFQGLMGGMMGGQKGNANNRGNGQGIPGGSIDENGNPMEVKPPQVEGSVSYADLPEDFEYLYGYPPETPINGALVTGFYRILLGREPDTEGYNYWINSGLTAGEVYQRFVASDEYKALNPPPQIEVDPLSQANEAIVETPETTLDKIIKRHKEEKRPKVADAIISLSTLIQAAEGGGLYGSYPTTRKVHSETYLYNAEDLLYQAQNLDDLMNILHRLQFDESLFGLDQLADYETEIDSPWGTVTQKINAYGEVSFDHKDSANTAKQDNFAQSMGNSQSNPSGGSGGNMFGGQAGQMMDMFKRLTPEAQQEAQKTMQKTGGEGMGGGGENAQLMQFVRTVVDGGDPMQMIKSMMG